MDREAVSGDALGLRAEAYRDFAHGLLTYIAQNAIAVRDSIGDLAEEVANELLASIFSRPFEIEPLKVEDAKLDQALDESLTWVFRRTHSIGRPPKMGGVQLSVADRSLNAGAGKVPRSTNLGGGTSALRGVDPSTAMRRERSFGPVEPPE